MENLTTELNQLITAFTSNLPVFLIFLGSLWLAHFVNVLLFKKNLHFLGIYPRHPAGLLGIVFSPFLHCDLNHLMVNSLMLTVLGLFILLHGAFSFWIITGIIIIISGALTWLLGRKMIHIGASGLVMGYWGFVLVNAYHTPTVLSIAVAAVCLYYFSSMFANLLPQGKEVSWEGHVFGFIAGIIAALSYPQVAVYLIQHNILTPP